MLMLITTVLNALTEIDGSRWLVRGDGISFSGEELSPAIAQYKSWLAAAQEWCFSKESPSVIITLGPGGDPIRFFNESALLLVGVSREQAKSSPPLKNADFWNNRQKYWEYRQTLCQQGFSEGRIDLVSYDGNQLGEIGVAARIVTPDLPLVVSWVT